MRYGLARFGSGEIWGLYCLRGGYRRVRGRQHPMGVTPALLPKGVFISTDTIGTLSLLNAFLIIGMGVHVAVVRHLTCRQGIAIS